MLHLMLTVKGSPALADLFKSSNESTGFIDESTRQLRLAAVFDGEYDKRKEVLLHIERGTPVV